jgi:hypothetical protein
MAVICVKDNGEGIPPQMLARVFNMFTQVEYRRARAGRPRHRAHARAHAGAPARRHHRGVSEGRAGLRVPGAPAARARAGEPRGVPASRRRRARLRRVLVVDDNHDAADSLGMLLSSSARSARWCTTARGARGDEDVRPAVVLLDLACPA